ncbi:MAG: sensor histidine kinase [Bacteroidota bacterium]
MRFSIRFLAAVLISLLIFPISTAGLFAQHLPFETYTTVNGLVQNSIRYLYQDSRGFLWIGTLDGLSIFDGDGFTNLTTQNGLPNDVINSIAEDAEGNVLVATNGVGVALFPEGRFDAPPSLFRTGRHALDAVNAIHVGLKSKTIVLGSDSSVLCIFRGSAIQMLPDQPQLGDGVYAFAEDSSGCVYAMTFSRGLFEITERGEARKPPFTHRFPRRYSAFAMLFVSADTLWVGTDHGLFLVVDRKKVSHFTANDGLPSNAVTALLRNPDGTLWCGTSAGLCHLSPSGKILHVYGRENGLVDDYVTALLRDSEGDLWVGTFGGLCKLEPEYFVLYATNMPGNPVIVQAIAGDRKGRLWIGGPEGIGVFEDGHFTPFVDLKLTRILPIWFAAFDSVHDGVWFAGMHGAAFMKVENSHPPQIHTFSQNEGMDVEWVTSINVDKNGNIWLVYPSGIQVARLTPDYHLHTVRRFAVGKEFKGTPQRVFFDRGGGIWIGTHSEVVRIHSNSMTSPGKANVISNFDQSHGFFPDIRAILEDRRGRIWFGTRYEGAYYVERTSKESFKATRFTERDGLSSNSVFALSEDRSGNIWIGTTRGVDWWDGAAIRHFSNGIVGDFTHCSFVDQNGTIWFGTSVGLLRFQSEASAREQSLHSMAIRPLRVLIKEIAVAGRELPLPKNREMHLEPRENSVGFHFTALSFRNRGAIRYSYMLAGLDQSWSAPTTETFVRYSNLAPGAYAFKVRAQSARGVWSEHHAEFRFSIARPLAREPWFIALIVAAVLSAIGGLVFYRVRHLLAIQRMRAAIASDLHDEIGAGLSHIAMMSEIARGEISKNLSGAAELLARISESARSLVEGIGDIIWVIDAKSDLLENVVLRICDFASELCEMQGMAFHCSFPPECREMHVSPQHRRNLLLLMKEAVHNAVLHSGGTDLWIEGRISDSVLELKISDNGIGVPAITRSEGRGLKNMQRRAESLGGSLTILPREGGGTVIAIQLKIPHLRY